MEAGQGMNNETPAEISVRNRRKRINEFVLTGLDRLIAKKRKAIAESEQDLQALLESRAIAREYGDNLK